MADQPSIFNDVGVILEALPQGQLVEISRRASLDGLQKICKNELGGRIAANVVAALFPEWPRARVVAVTQQIGITAIRNAWLKNIVRVPGPWEATVRCPDREAALALRALQGPAILVYWHFGPVTMIPLGFRRIGITAQVFTRAKPVPWTNTPDFAPMRLTVHDAQQSVTALRRALQYLKKGGKVAIAVDGSMGKRDIEIPFLGRRFAVSRGASGLARLTGAPVIPCTMQWEPDGWSMAIRVFEPLPKPSTPEGEPEAFEQALLTTAGRCFESYAREHPEQFKIDQLAELIDSPPLNS